MVDAQTFIDTYFTDKTINQITNQDLIDMLNAKGIAISGLTGALKLEGFKNLTKIEINDAKKVSDGLNNDLTGLTIVDCPKLKTINVRENKLKNINLKKTNIDGNSEGTDNIINQLTAGQNELITLNIENCPKLESVFIADNPDLKKIKGETVNVKEVNSQGTAVVFTTEGELTNLKDIKKYAKKILGGKIPMKNERVDTDKLETEMEEKIISAKSPGLKTAKENAEKEAQQAKQELETVKAERDQLKKQLAEIKNELNLEENVTQQQILDQIKELMKRPTSSCSHTDYDSIKTERDNLRNEVENKNRRISELENENKENVGMTKEALFESTKTHLGKLGVKVLDNSKLQNAATAHNVENIRNEIISSEFNKLKDERNSAHYLNLGLGAIALGSLIFIAWMVMRQNNNLLKKEPEKKKE